MQKSNKSRYTLLVLIIFLYLVPLLLLSSYGRLYMPAQKGWNLLTFGLFMGSIGTLCLFWMMCRTDEQGTSQEIDEKVLVLPKETLPISVSQPDSTQTEAFEELQGQHSEIQEQLIRLQSDLEVKNEELQGLQHEYQVLQNKLENAGSEHEVYKQTVQTDLEQQQKLISDSQKTISDQRESLDKKLQQIAQLESKVSDLTYEIKTLIQLAEIENQSMPIYSNLPVENSIHDNSSPIEMEEDGIPNIPEKQIRNEVQAAMQLKRCIDIAQKITGASHYNSTNSRFKDLAVDNYTLDLRRLFDSLRMENASAVIFYSQKENKVLFINNQSRNLLGWSPDKFVQSFGDIIEPSKEEWKQGIASLAIKNDVQVSLKMKSKSGSPLEVQGLLGIIPTGIFRYHVLGLLYQKSSA
jgi:hypothetical protein